jgi:hypothetical protein
MKHLLRGLLCVIFGSLLRAQQPVDAPLLPLGDLRPGMKGEVWTVFQGTQPEPFAVEVTGIVQNALGPGKSLILCRLTDERVQNMGAVAGMSGSPLYIEGKLAGALSYQVQRFETVRYAGFTPAADLAEVSGRMAVLPSLLPEPGDSTRVSAEAGNLKAKAILERRDITGDSSFKPLQPVFTLSGLSPTVAELLGPQFTALGLGATALGGSSHSGPLDPALAIIESTPLRAGSAVSVALATGDITLAGTGTVSRIEGNHVTAFGHPMLSLGDVDLPMCSAEILAILPSNMQSFKIANTGAVIGTISQDRLSAVSGTLGTIPAMIPVEVMVADAQAPARTLHFSVVRHVQITPALVAAGVSQAIMGSNDAGLSEGFRLSTTVAFPAGQTLNTQTVYAGPQAFAQGLNEFVRSLSGNLMNPYEKTFPDKVSFTVEPLAQNPTAVLELFQLSRTSARSGEKVEATVAWRDWQGEAHREIVGFDADPSWNGKSLQVVLVTGRSLDELTGHARLIPASQLRSFGAYLDAMRDDRRTDGLYLAVVESAPVFTDQTTPTLDLPGSFERIARGADESRYQKHDAMVPLWEKQILPGKVISAQLMRTLRVID